MADDILNTDQPLHDPELEVWEYLQALRDATSHSPPLKNCRVVSHLNRLGRSMTFSKT